MKKHLILFLGILLSVFQIHSEGVDVLTLTKIDNVEHYKSINSHFIGVSNFSIIYGGGCLDNDTTNAPQSEVYKITELDNNVKSELIGQLPSPRKSSKYITTSKGVVIIGGLDSQSVVSAVDQISFEAGKLVVTQLPHFPYRVMHAGVTMLGNDLFVIGGIQNEMSSNKVFSLDLSTPNSEWIERLSLPEIEHVDLIATTQNGGDEDLIYVFASKIYKYSKKRDEWTTIANSDDANLPDKLSAQPIGTHHILLTDKKGETFTFHTITERFSFLAIANGEVCKGLLSSKIDGKYWAVGSDIHTLTIESKPHFGLLNFIVLFAYLAVMIGVGFYFSLKAKTGDNFFKGGGKIPWWAAGISIFAATLSAITFMAIPAKAYTTNWLYFPMSFSILCVAPIIIHWYLPFFRRLNLTSAYEYLEKRFNLAVRILSSAFFIIFMVTRIAIVLYLPSVALATVTGMDIFLCIALMSIITLIYATLGGVEAVVWGDVIQGIILVGGAILSTLYIVFNTGGLGETIRIASEASKFDVLNFALDFTQPTFWVIFFGAGIANSLITYSSDQTIIQKYLTTADEKKAAKSLWLNGILALPVLLLFYFIGTALYSYYFTKPELLPISMNNAEGIFPFFIVNELPNGVAGLLIAAIFAATMSTLSSNINSASTAFTMDFVKLFRPNISDKGQVLSARISGIVVCFLGTALAVILSTLSVKSFFDEFNTFIGLLTSGLGGLFAIGIFLPRVKGWAALGGLISSIIVLLWIRSVSPINFMLYGLIGIAVSMIIAYVLSFIFPEKENDLTGLTWKNIK